MGSLLYPRLPRPVAQSLLLERADMPLSELAALSAVAHIEAEPAATGGHPADPQKIDQVRNTVREIAAHAGYPHAPNTAAQQAFDRACGSTLLSTMEIVPADAAEEGVWTFLSLVVVPEIGPWRFPGRSEERLLGRPRNVLRRTWWRAWALGPELERAPAGCTPLREDESVQIMERPSLGGNRRTAQALQSALWRAEAAGLTVARSDVMRELARRVRAAKSHISLDALDDVVLESLLDQLTGDSVNALSSVS